MRELEFRGTHSLIIIFRLRAFVFRDHSILSMIIPSDVTQFNSTRLDSIGLDPA